MIVKLVFLAILALVQGRPESLDRHLEPHELCPPAEHHWLLPHEYDCTLFYYCEYGLKWIEPRKCADGTEFSSELQVCVHPNEANCNLSGSPTTAAPAPSPTNAPSPTAAPTAAPIEADGEEDNGDEETEVELLPNGCPADYNVDLLFPHADCDKFYQCTHGEKVEMMCPVGQHYNAAEHRCDWPGNAGCEAGSGGEDAETGGEDGEDEVEDGENGVDGGEDGGDEDKEVEILPNGCPADYTVEQLFPHPDCDKFYQCTHGEKVEMMCTLGQHYNAAEQKCDWPETAGCDSSIGGGVGGNGEDSGNGENGGENGGDEDKEVEILPNGCPADYTVDQLFPHPDCDKFYQCTHGEWVEMMCSLGQHYNMAEQKCDWPETAGCDSSIGGGVGGNGEDSGNGGEDNGNGENGGEDGGNGENGGDEDKEVEILPNGCPADYTVDQLFPHPDCDKFYQCTHGEKVEMMCSLGQHFNVALQACDWPENAGCDSSIGGGVGGNGEDSGNGETGGENGGDEDKEVEILPNGCPADYTVEQLFPHPDCDKFYQCTHGEWVEMMCSLGQHYNMAEQKCDWPENAGCDSSIGGGVGGNGEDSGNGGEDNGNGENGGEDGGNGENGGEEDKEVEILPNGCPADYTVDQLFPHPDCDKFYQCTHGEKVEMMCSLGQHFNVALQACDWPENAGCDASIGGGDGGNGNGDGGNGNGDEDNNGDGENGNGENGGGNGDGGNGDGENVELLPNGCPADYSVLHLLPHENDCGKFYVCVWGELVERECHLGTHFNPTLQICDWPWNAGCESGDSDGGNGDGGNGNGENGKRCAGGCNVLPWAHSADCNKYWRCNGEVANLVSCSEGLKFNAATGSCDFASNVSC